MLKKQQKEKDQQFQRSSAQGEYQSLKSYAVGKFMPFDLEYGEFRKLADADCYFCSGRTPGYETNSLVAKEYRDGFVSGNVLPCCWACKRAVLAWGGVDGFLRRIQRIWETVMSR